jgi:hypothetical protein
MNRKTMWLLTTALAFSLPAFAEDAAPPPPKEDEAKPPTDETKTPPPHWTTTKGSDKQVSRLAAEYQVTEQQVVDLRNRGMGWGEVRHALSISKRADVPLADVLKLRDSGMGWGQIAHKYELKVDGKVRDAVNEPRKTETGTGTTSPSPSSRGNSGMRGNSGRSRPERGYGGPRH